MCKDGGGVARSPMMAHLLRLLSANGASHKAGNGGRRMKVPWCWLAALAQRMGDFAGVADLGSMAAASGNGAPFRCGHGDLSRIHATRMIR